MDAEIGRRFVDTMRGWLISLPHDLKIVYEATADENLDRAARELAPGAIIYVVSPNDFVSSDRSDFSGYADDCVILRLALRRIAAKKDEDSQQFRDRFEDFFGASTRSSRSARRRWASCTLARRASITCPSSSTRARRSPVYLDDEELSELLYEDGLVFATEYPVDEDDLADSFKKASTIIEVIQRRKAEEDRKKAASRLRWRAHRSTSSKLVRRLAEEARRQLVEPRGVGDEEAELAAAGLERRPAASAARRGARPSRSPSRRPRSGGRRARRPPRPARRRSSG